MISTRIDVKQHIETEFTRAEHRVSTLRQQLELLERDLASLETLFHASLSNGTNPSGLDLDDQRIGRAIVIYLKWAWKQGLREVTAGDLHDVLKRYRVITSHGNLFRELENPWRILALTVTSPRCLRKWWKLNWNGRPMSRKDTVSLLFPPE